MKKIFAILLSALLTLSLAACGTSKANTEKNEIGQLIDEGYESVMSTWEDDKWAGILQKDESYLKVTADFPASLQDEYNSLDIFDDDYNEKADAIIFSLDNVQTEDVSDQVPTQEELDVYVGKTIGDLENEGYENNGYSGDEETGSYTFTLEGDKYCIDVGMREGDTIEDMDDYSANDIREIVIGSVTFNSFSFNFLSE